MRRGYQNKSNLSTEERKSGKSSPNTPAEGSTVSTSAWVGSQKPDNKNHSPGGGGGGITGLLHLAGERPLLFNWKLNLGPYAK